MTIGRIPSVEGGIQPTIFTTKGDILVATANATVTRQGVGSDGQVLTADSTQADGIAWSSVATPYAAGKNKIINGDFRVNQRNFTSITSSSTNQYFFDRFFTNSSGGTVTVTPQTFTAGTAPVAGYEAINFAQVQTASQSATTHYAYVSQPVEDVRTFAGQTVTLSFWAKVTSGTASLWTELNQDFGSGGSSQVVNAVGTASLTTSWTRFNYTFTLASLSGKTIGTNNALQTAFWFSSGSAIRTGYGIQNATFQIWGVQLEAGSVATPFQTATGTIQGELAACQRYYAKSYDQGTAPAASTTNGVVNILVGTATTAVLGTQIRFPVVMRTAPTITVYDGAGASGKCYKGANGKTGIADYIGDAGARLYTNDATSSNEFYAHYVASSEF